MFEFERTTADSLTIERPCLYLVATPIGNLNDISWRALQVIAHADVLLAEDTRNSRVLLERFGISREMEAYHLHNEAARTSQLVARALTKSLALALISDAGSPLISDPGLRLVQGFIAAELPVRVIPGPCAVIAALLTSGFPAENFVFGGFLASKSVARRKQLGELKNEPRTVLFYEAPHRIIAALADLEEVLGPAREVAVMRELTKLHETAYRGTLANVRARVAQDPHGARGEFVIAIAPASIEATDDAEPRRILGLLLAHMSPKLAVDLAAKLTSIPRNKLYSMALALHGEAGKN